MREQPAISEILATLTWFASALRIAKDKPGFNIGMPQAHHITRLDAAINLIGSLQCSPGAQLVLSELGFRVPLSPPVEGNSSLDRATSQKGIDAHNPEALTESGPVGRGQTLEDTL